MAHQNLRVPGLTARETLEGRGCAVERGCRVLYGAKSRHAGRANRRNLAVSPAWWQPD